MVNFSEMFGKMYLKMILKMTKNDASHSLQTVYFLKYILRVKAWIFLNETSILAFAELAIYHSI